MSPPSVPSRAEVKAACDASGPKTNGIAYDDNIWIKYGVHVTRAEALSQQHVHKQADPNIVRTAAVYDCFTVQRTNAPPITYIVMEKLGGTPLTAHESDVDLDRIAAAVRHIWSLPLPPQAGIGPLAGQIPHDRFFSDSGAGRTFQSTDDLQGWINTRLEDEEYDERVELSEECHICHCDLSQFNLRRDPIVILDWGMSGIYPRAFEEYALVRQFNLKGSRFAKALHKKLFGGNLSKQIRPLAIAARIDEVGW